MPRGLSILGLIGGAPLCISGLGVVLDVIPKGGTAQTIATIPEFFWELSLGIYPIVKGFRHPQSWRPASKAGELPLLGLLQRRPRLDRAKARLLVWNELARLRRPEPPRRRDARSSSGGEQISGAGDASAPTRPARPAACWPPDRRLTPRGRGLAFRRHCNRQVRAGASARAVVPSPVSRRLSWAISIGRHAPRDR